jgi:hypothetical protein
MKVTNVSASDMSAAMAEVNKAYDGNVMFNRFDSLRNGFNFTLRVRSSKAPGHRVSHTGRRIPSACWHVHRDFMRALFALQPDATIRSHLACYKGKNGFERDYPATGSKNIGSIMQPLYFEEACEC